MNNALRWAPACFAAGLLLLSCGSGGTAGGEAEFELDVNNCGGFTVADAAAFFNAPPEGWRDDSQPLGDNSRWCIFNNSGDSGPGLNFSIRRSDSVEQAKTEFQQFRGNVGVAVSVLGDKFDAQGRQPHNVPGLGDEALWTPVPGALYARKGRYSVQVNQPSEEELQVRVMRKILREQ